MYVNFIVCKRSLHFYASAGICNSTLNVVFLSSQCEHWYWIHQLSGSSLSMYNSTMKWFSFLVIILGFTSGKSLVVGSTSNKYEESSNVRNAVIFFLYFELFQVQCHTSVKHSWNYYYFVYILYTENFQKFGGCGVQFSCIVNWILYVIQLTHFVVMFLFSNFLWPLSLLRFEFFIFPCIRIHFLR